jgi:hypothetical protein
VTISGGAASGAGSLIDVDVDTISMGRTYLRLRFRHISGERHDFVTDTNHAGALVLALQAAIAEAEARAVSL